MKRIIPIFLLIPFLMGAASRSFDGSNDEISAGNVLDVTTGNVSICLWGKTTEDAGNDFFIGKDSGGAGVGGYNLLQQSDDLIKFAVGVAGTDTSAIGTTDNDGLWAFACGTWDGTNDIAKVYVNGVNETTTDTSGIGSLTNAVNFKVGEDGGEFSDFLGPATYGKQFTAILTAVEISELMWKPEIIVIATPNLFWPLWGDSTEIDLSGNARTGTVTDATTSTDGPPSMWGGGLPL